MLHKDQDLYRFDDFELQPSRRVLMRCGAKVAIAPKTFEVLLYLVQNAGRVVLKEELLKAVWPDSFVEESNLTQHVFWLRKALADRADYIATIPGRGYEFAGKVEVVREEPETPAEIGFRIRRSVERTRVVVEESGIGGGAPHALSGSVPWSRSWVIAGTAIVLIALVGWGAWHRLHGAVPGDHHEVVLADFENSTGEPDFDRALKTLLAMDLNESPYLAVADDADTRKMLTLMERPPDAALSPAVALEVCQRMNDQAVLSGLIARFGQKYLITLTATDCSDGKELVRTKAIADNREDSLHAVDTVAAEMRRRLGETLRSRPNAAKPLPPVHTFSLDALRAYSQALALCSTGRRQEAVPLYQRAIELDPKFAAAYRDLGRCYAGLREYELSKAALTRAYELRDQGDDLLRLTILAAYGELVTGDDHAQLRTAVEWTELYPNQPEAWINLAGRQKDLAHPELAIEPSRRAIALAPNDGKAYENLASTLFDNGRLEDAKAVCREAVRRQIDTFNIHYLLHSIAYLQHDTAAMQEQVDYYKSTDDGTMLFDYPLLAEGKIHAAEANWLKNIDRARKAGLNEMADRRLRILMRREAEYGMDAQLREHLAMVDPAKYPLNLVFANAELGRIAAAEAAVKMYAATVGSDTTNTEVFLPSAEAAVALARHRPQEAIADLEVERPYDLMNPEAVLIRGQAYLASHKPTQAEAEFREIINHPWTAAGAPAFPLAHLGLARALEMGGNHAAARREYETLFELWKDADVDLPPLREARAEYARIR